jgi:hypothetical protein
VHVAAGARLNYQKFFGSFIQKRTLLVLPVGPLAV